MPRYRLTRKGTICEKLYAYMQNGTLFWAVARSCADEFEEEQLKPLLSSIGYKVKLERVS